MARKKVQDETAALDVSMTTARQALPPGILQVPPAPTELKAPAEPASAEKIIQRQLELLGERSRKGLLTYDETKALDSLVKLQMLMKLRASKAGSDATYDDLSSEELKAFMNELNRE